MAASPILHVAMAIAGNSFVQGVVGAGATTASVGAKNVVQSAEGIAEKSRGLIDADPLAAAALALITALCCVGPDEVGS